MKSFAPLLLSLATALAAGPGLAQPAGGAGPPANFAPPRAYDGYSQPEITGCETTGVNRRECTAPAMTAGRYLVVAAGSATSNGANSAQSLVITLGGAACFAARSPTFTGVKGLRGACEANLLTDKPLVIAALYSVQSGTPDPKGPQLVVRRLPWNGVVEAHAVALPAPKGANGSADAGAKPKGK